MPVVRIHLRPRAGLARLVTFGHPRRGPRYLPGGRAPGTPRFSAEVGGSTSAQSGPPAQRATSSTCVSSCRAVGPCAESVVEGNLTYRLDLPGRRTQCDDQSQPGVLTVICVVEIDVHEVWLLVAASVVLVAQIERDVRNREPSVARAAPRCSTPVLEFLGVETSEPVHRPQIGVPDATGLAGVDAPPSLLSKFRAASRIAVKERDPDLAVILVLK